MGHHFCHIGPYVSFLMDDEGHTFATKSKDMNDVYSFNSVEEIPDLKASAAFTVNSSEVFKEQVDMLPVTIDKDMRYMPSARTPAASAPSSSRPTKRTPTSWALQNTSPWT